jgi:RNA polymerase sigma-70 factor (ECF subfamily)
VFTIARARLVDARRTAARTPVPVDVTAELAEMPAAADVPACVEELMSTEAALALIGRLPPDQAEAVLLRHVVGLDPTQAAAVLGKRPGPSGSPPCAAWPGCARCSRRPAPVELPAPGCNATDRANG